MVVHEPRAVRTALRRHVRHEFAFARQRANRKAVRHGLAEGSQIGSDLEQSLCAADIVAKSGEDLIEDQNHAWVVARQVAQQLLNMASIQGRAHRGNDVGDAALMGQQHVGIAFDDGEITRRDGRLPYRDLHEAVPAVNSASEEPVTCGEVGPVTCGEAGGGG